MDKYIPDMYVKSIFNINYSKLRDLGIKCLIFDLDNTLALVHENLVLDEVKEKIKELKKEFHVCIISNGFRKRIKPLCESLDLEFFSFSMKPSTRAFKKFLNKYKDYTKKDICLIGDQLMTDVKAGKGFGIFTILVDPLSEKEQKITSFNRFFERRRLKVLTSMGILERGKYYE